MQICIAFLLITLGGGLYGLHTHICRKCEKCAWQNGYMQAQKEEQMRLQAVEQYKAQLRPIVPQGVEEKGTPFDNGAVIDCNFVDEMRKNGRAVVRLRR